MKKTRNTIFAIALSSSIFLSSCIGSFSAFNGILKWNEGVGDKFVNELVFAGLWIIPVYELATTCDLFIFNTIEFWTGNNPIGMKAGEMKEKTFASHGKEYKMVLTQNHISIVPMNGEKSTNLVFLPDDASWNLETANGLVKLSQLSNEKVNGKQMIKMFYPNNQVALVEADKLSIN